MSAITSRTSRPTRLILIALLGAPGVLKQNAQAATITYAGTESSNGSSYPVHDWSNPAIAKSHDSDGNNTYGSAGYWQVRPMPADPGTATIAESAGGGNDLGTSAGSDPTLSSAPTFLSSIAGGAGTYVNFGGYPNFRGPDGSVIYRQGALSVPVNQGPYNSPAGNDASHVGVPFQFTLGTSGKLRLGIAVDTVADGNYAPQYVSVYSSSTGTIFSPALTRDGNPDMVFFDITGDLGDTFIIGLWQNVGTQSVAALSLITFDGFPETGTPLLSYVIQDGSFHLSWPEETTGWTLESSIDLGNSDQWDPVPGVVNNSVSMPMTVPRNFFRLRKNP